MENNDERPYGEVRLDMINIQFPVYIPVRMKENIGWEKEQKTRTRQIHDLVEKKFKLGWRYCFDIPAFYAGIVCSIVPEHKIGDGLIDLDIEQSKEFRSRFILTTNKMLDILEKEYIDETFENEEELKDLLFGNTIICSKGDVWKRKKDEDEDEDED